MPRTVEIEKCEAVAETDLAICVEMPDQDEDVWIPKSQIDNSSEVWKKGHEGVLIVSEWFAEREGLV